VAKTALRRNRSSLHRPEISPEERELAKLVTSLEDVVSVGYGDLDSDTPAHIIEEAATALAHGATHYTHWQGLVDLREALTRRLREAKDLSYEPDEIVVTVGGQEAILLTFLALLESGDEVIVPDPYYIAYERAIRLAGGTTVYAPTTIAHDFILQADTVAELIGLRTKALVIVSPNNPTGAVATRQALQDLAELAIEHDLIVISDEIYSQYTYDGTKHTSIASLPGMRERTIVINGFSKTYAMTGWRLGYFAAPRDFVETLHPLRHTLNICAPAVSQHGALAALEGPQTFVRNQQATYSKRRELLMNACDEMGLRYGFPGGGMYMWVDISSTGLGCLEFSRRLLAERRVRVSPGTNFSKGDGFVRFAYLAPTKELEEAMRRMKPFVKSLLAGS